MIIAVVDVWVFIAQLVEHCSANAEAMGSNPVEAPKTFLGLTLRLLKSQFQLRRSHLHFIRLSAVHIIFINYFLVLHVTKWENTPAVAFEVSFANFYLCVWHVILKLRCYGYATVQSGIVSSLKRKNKE